jgi:hypothetical protein
MPATEKVKGKQDKSTDNLLDRDSKFVPPERVAELGTDEPITDLQ